jgi:hypothetical protein
MSAYAEPDGVGIPTPLTAADISTLFKKPAGWFGRDVVRKRLYAKGFPHPLERGLWSAVAVANWMASAGSNPAAVAPPSGRKPRPAPGRRRPNGYAPVAGPH